MQWIPLRASIKSTGNKAVWAHRWVHQVQLFPIPLHTTKKTSWAVAYNCQGPHHFYLVEWAPKYSQVRGHSEALLGKMNVQTHQNFGSSLCLSAVAIPWASVCSRRLAHHWGYISSLGTHTSFIKRCLSNIYTTHTQCMHLLLLSSKTLAATLIDIKQYSGLSLIQSRNWIFPRPGKKVKCCKHTGGERCWSQWATAEQRYSTSIQFTILVLLDVGSRHKMGGHLL